MRRLLLLLTASAVLAALPASAPAKSTYKSCSDVNTKIGGKNYKIAIKVQAKGVGCAQTKPLLISLGTGNPITPPDAALDKLKTRCRTDKNQKAATKKRRSAYTCTSADGKRSVKAWMMNG